MCCPCVQFCFAPPSLLSRLSAISCSSYDTHGFFQRYASNRQNQEAQHNFPTVFKVAKHGEIMHVPIINIGKFPKIIQLKFQLSSKVIVHKDYPRDTKLAWQCSLQKICLCYKGSISFQISFQQCQPYLNQGFLSDHKLDVKVRKVSVLITISSTKITNCSDRNGGGPLVNHRRQSDGRSIVQWSFNKFSDQEHQKGEII